MKALIVAYDKNRCIGVGHEISWEKSIPWGRDLAADRRHFVEITKGHTIIMGRNTFESIGSALPKRLNIVVTRRALQAENIVVVDSLPAAYTAAQQDYIVIGGASVYEQAMTDVTTIYATEVAAIFDGASAFFKELSGDWIETAREHHEADDTNKYAYDFVTYERN